MTDVTNTKTKTVLTYSLPPNEAVVAAFQQEVKRNFNTWSYDFSAAVRDGDFWVCGDFRAPAAQ